jgi:hypothetical protein
MKTISMLPQKVRGFARDFSVDQLPSGFVWNLVDYIPDRHQAKLGGRGAWTYMTNAPLAGTVWGGYHAAFTKGARLLVCAGSTLYDQQGWQNADLTSQGAATQIGTMFASGKQNGVMLRDRVYFADATGIQFPKYVTFNGSTFTIGQLSGANAPHASVLGVYKDRLLGGGDPGNPTRLYFSKLEKDGGPVVDWDVLSYIDTSRDITAIMPMPSTILVFHDGFTEKIRGAVPPGKNIDTDMSLDTFTAQLGCVDPSSIVAWQENVIFANMHGIHITDGSTTRSLTDQGGVSEAWRELYALKRSGTQVSAEVYLDQLYVSILTSYSGSTPVEQRSFLFVCDLSERTWHRFENVEATAMIRSEIAAEQVWWGVDPQNRAAAFANRLARLSPMMAAQREANPDNPVAPYPDVVDADGNPVLPRVETGWMKMSKNEVEKRIRHLYVSHSTQSQSQPTADALNVSAKVSAAPYSTFQSLGNIPASARYVRRRVRLGRPAYGLQVKIEQTIPSHLSALYDIGVEAWANDGGKL